MDQRERDALDRSITGNYGEDQFKPQSRQDERMHAIDVKGVIFGFVRRRYGKRTFTWLHYKDENDQWQEYKGDPWPSIKIPMADLLKVREELLAQFPDEPQYEA